MSSSPSRLSVERLETPRDLARWDEFVRRSPQCNPFAMSAWLVPSCAMAGATFDLHVALRGAEWVAGAPSVHRRRLGLPFHFGLPLAVYDTWLFRPATGASEASATSERLESARALLDADRGGVRAASHLLVPAVRDARPWIWAGWTATPRYTYVLDLTAPLPVSDSVRRHLRKCREAGYTMSFAWDPEAFRAVFEETRRRQGFGLRLTRRHFEDLAGGLHGAGLAWMAIARTSSGEPAAGHIALAVPGDASMYMWVAGTATEHLKTGVSPWMMTEVALEGARRGHRAWDLCGADLPGVARFKSELGGRLEHYVQVDAPRGPLERVAFAAKRTLADLRRPSASPRE